MSSHGVVLLDSIAMRLQVIGEIVKKIEKSDQAILNNFPNIEWNMIIRLRDIISHHYAVIDHEIIYGAHFKTFQFGQAQGGRKFQPQEYIEYFED